MAAAAIATGGSGGWTPNPRDALKGIAMVIVACCTNVWTLELITKVDPSSGNLVTFGHFLAVIAKGFTDFYVFPFSFKPLAGSLTTYIKLTLLFFISAVLNNRAVGYSISIPMHTVFRSSGLVATYLSGRLWYGVRYARHQTYASLLVTIGILCITLADSSMHRVAPPSSSLSSSSSTIDAATATAAPTTTTPTCAACAGIGALFAAVHPQLERILLDACEWMASADLLHHIATSSLALNVSTTWLTGVAMLTIGLFTTAFLSHEQEFAYKAHGKSTWREALFYTHLLALPCFALVLPDIVSHATLWLTLPPVQVRLPSFVSPMASSSVASLSLPIPIYVIYAVNLATQLLCVSGVSIVTSNTNALTTQLVVTVRKIISLLLSIVIFQNTFTIAHWIGTIIIFSGVFLYSNGGAWVADRTSDDVKTKDKKTTKAD